MISLTSNSISQEEIKSVIAVMSSDHLERHEITKKLEQNFATYFSVKNAILTNNGTTALYATLKSFGIGEGDEVITSPFSFVASVNAIILTGATPVFVDIDKSTFNIDSNQVIKKITAKTKAILSVDLYGQPADYISLSQIAQNHSLYLISDSCQTIGASVDSSYISDYTNATVHSFFNTKNITSGEGGVVLTNDAEVAAKINQCINHGQVRGKKYTYVDVGWNFRPTDIQAAILTHQLKKLKKINKKRIENARYLNEQLSGIKGLILPEATEGTTHVFSRYTVKITKKFSLTRPNLVTYLQDHGIESEVAYPEVLYNYTHLKKYKKESCSNAEEVVSEVLSLPVHQNLKLQQLQKIIEVLKQASL